MRMGPGEFVTAEIFHRVMLFTYGALFAQSLLDHHYSFAVLTAAVTFAVGFFDTFSNLKRQALLHKQHDLLMQKAGLEVSDE